MSLAYPGETGTLVESLGRDCFLDSLCEPGLKITILEQRPTDLDNAFQLASQMSCYVTPGMMKADSASEYCKFDCA